MLLKTLIPQISSLIPYEYDKIKNTQYEKIIENQLQTANSSVNPKFHHMFGIPGAGKSTFYHCYKWEPHILISFDSIMEHIPDYQKDIKQKKYVQAFNNWEIPARIIGYELLRRAVEAQKNIFFDHGGAFPAHLDLIRNIRLNNYQTEIYYIQCNVQLAIKRAQEREKTTHRHTPPQMIEERSQIIAKLCPEYKKAADAFYVYENKSNGFILDNEASKFPFQKIV